jgi:uncharacterized protein YggU (UPF0235/DUF167 family)
VPKSDVEIARGARGREKVVAVRGLKDEDGTEEKIRERLTKAIED